MRDFPLHDAIREKDVQKIISLLKKKYNVNTEDYNQSTPLHTAIKNECSKTIINLLFKWGADVNAKD